METMTREEILAMKPGRELDIEIAQKIFGFTYQKAMHINVLAPPYSDCVQIYSGVDKNYFVPKYSRNVSAAWGVVEKLSKEGYFVNVCRFPNTDRSNVHIQEVKNKYTGELQMPIELQGESAPEAICKVALIAVLEKK